MTERLRPGTHPRTATERAALQTRGHVVQDKRHPRGPGSGPGRLWAGQTALSCGFLPGHWAAGRTGEKKHAGAQPSASHAVRR